MGIVNDFTYNIAKIGIRVLLVQSIGNLICPITKRQHFTFLIFPLRHHNKARSLPAQGNKNGAPSRPIS